MTALLRIAQVAVILCKLPQRVFLIRVKGDELTSETSKVRIAARFLIFFLGLAAAFFGTAGTFVWPEAWLYLTLQFSFSATLAVWLSRNDPELLRNRMRLFTSSARSWDKVVLWISTIICVPFLLLPGLDAVRYRWSSVPWLCKVLAFAGIGSALLLIAWVMRENTYLSRFVEIQKERGHKVITTGPYQWVRHPMYVGVILILVCFPLALGSLWTLVPAFLLIVVLIIRTHLEDKTLQEELAGYKEYARIVVYRLVPGLW